MPAIVDNDLWYKLCHMSFSYPKISFDNGILTWVDQQTAPSTPKTFAAIGTFMVFYSLFKKSSR